MHDHPATKLRDGSQPKFLVIIDDTPECDRAVYYASRWAIRVGGGVVMLRVIETEDQNQQWLGVADIMRAEAEEAANAALDRAAGRANGIAAITPERVIREGDPTEQILDLIDEDDDIAILVLAANPGPEGPGPLVASIAPRRSARSRFRSPSCRRPQRRGHRRAGLAAVVRANRCGRQNCWILRPLDRAFAVAIC